MRNGRNPPTMSWDQWLDELRAAAKMIMQSFLVKPTELPVPNGKPVEMGMIFTGFAAPNFLYRKTCEIYEDALGIPFVTAVNYNHPLLGLNSVSLWNIAVGIATSAIEKVVPFRLPFKLPKYEVFWSSVKDSIKEIFMYEVQGYKVAVIAAHSLGGDIALIMALLYPKIHFVVASTPRDLTTSPLLNYLAINSLGLPPNFRFLADELCKDIQTNAQGRVRSCGDDPLVSFLSGKIPACREYDFHGLPGRDYVHVSGIHNPAVIKALVDALRDYRSNEKQSAMLLRHNGKKLAA